MAPQEAWRGLLAAPWHTGCRVEGGEGQGRMRVQPPAGLLRPREPARRARPLGRGSAVQLQYSPLAQAVLSGERAHGLARLGLDDCHVIGVQLVVACRGGGGGVGRGGGVQGGVAVPFRGRVRLCTDAGRRGGAARRRRTVARRDGGQTGGRAHRAFCRVRCRRPGSRRCRCSRRSRSTCPAR